MQKANPVLNFAYRFLKVLVNGTFPLYFRKTVIIDREKLHVEGPCILVSNHPNTMIDPLQVASKVDTYVYFLANSGLFKTAFTNWFFNTMFCIPIERPQDTGGKIPDNEESFKRCDEFLDAGGCLYIAAEGTSEMERRLHRLRTGTARIGLHAEAGNGFQLGLTILPVGLTYSEPHRFRSDVVVHAGDGLKLAGYKDAYAADRDGTVKQVTADLQQRMSELIVDIPTDIDEKLFSEAETLLQSEAKKGLKKTYFRNKALTGALAAWKTGEESLFRDWAHETGAYFDLLQKKGIRDADFKLSQKQIFLLLIRDFFYLLINLPVFLWGVINNFFPVALPLLAIRIVKPYIGFHTTFKYLLSVISFPLCYFFQTRFVLSFFYNDKLLMAILYFLTAFLSLFWAVAYRRIFHKWLSRLRLYLLALREGSPVKRLRGIREKILAPLREMQLP